MATKSWEVSDSFWEYVKPLIPHPQRDKNKEYQRRKGAGRKPMESRKTFEAIVYVLRTGIQWKALPKEYGSSSSIHRYFRKWETAGFFLKLWKKGLAEYGEMKGISWKWQSIDGAMKKAPIAQETVGPNPTDRGKKWNQAAAKLKELASGVRIASSSMPVSLLVKKFADGSQEIAVENRAVWGRARSVVSTEMALVWTRIVSTYPPRVMDQQPHSFTVPVPPRGIAAIKIGKR